MKYKIENTIIEIDRDKMPTLQMYDLTRVTALCPDYGEAIGALPEATKDLFRGLSLDIYAPNEIYDLNAEENGASGYGGWWFLCGKVLKNGGTTVVGEGFEITFHEEFSHIPKWFPPPVVQIRFTCRKAGLSPMGKTFGTDGKATFCYRIGQEAEGHLQSLIGKQVTVEALPPRSADQPIIPRQTVRIDTGTDVYTATVTRDMDTCHEGIDRMKMDLICEPHAPHPIGRATGTVQTVKIFESSIEGAHDAVIYDSHILIEFDSGRKAILRAEPDGSETVTLFENVRDRDMDRYLLVSDTWFAPPSLVVDEKDEIIGMKHFYQVQTMLRTTIT